MKRIMVTLCVCTLSLSCLFALDWDLITKAVASDREASDMLGNSVAISNNWAVVGAPSEDENIFDSDSLNGAGAAYVYYNNGSTWTQTQKLVASDRAAIDLFGYAVAISGDYMVISAKGEDEGTANFYVSAAGSAYIFKLNGSVWEEQQKIAASDRRYNDGFGWRVAISGDYIVVGVMDSDTDENGLNILNDAGAAYVYYNNGTSWSEQKKLVAPVRTASDDFGIDVAISGDYIIVGCRMDDEDENELNPLSYPGSAYIYKRNGTTWDMQQKIVASDRTKYDQFGTSVGISGDYAVVGAPLEDHDANGLTSISSAGSAYIFKLSDTTWTQQQKIAADQRSVDDKFGGNIDISNDCIMVGAYNEDEDINNLNYVENAGAAYIFKNNEGTWFQQQKLVAPVRSETDLFPYSLDISGGYAIAGVVYEDEDANETNTLNMAGAAYIYMNGTEIATPITLKHFSAENKNGKVLLSWTTESETENSHFLVYRDGQVIAQIEAAGSTTEQHSYSYLDVRVQCGVHTYAIADVSYGGIKKLHSSVEIEVDGGDMSADNFILNKAYPNPFNPRTAINYQLSHISNIDLSIYNTDGERITTLYK